MDLILFLQQKHSRSNNIRMLIVVSNHTGFSPRTSLLAQDMRKHDSSQILYQLYDLPACTEHINAISYHSFPWSILVRNLQTFFLLL